ncbi:MAG: 1-(5-phosphoribosyl)-5-[(5-phosphoribosylamino)methylideneamino]imidazole-4-carboxamide isomerase [Deltaproteobacteria bacterium RBG_13_61_14]|nr:MAG: 1-(5-phosphoribosyl)-5-[(5-phosphoribosylamino)methylideneamino]imidazole-4-carboxamide isomerase [Deltaproteobacteria bacterium RBG_13_61_14]
MIVIPAIDLKSGQVVRLEQGRLDRDKVYSSDPAATAKKFAEAGAELIHVVDLDGAFQKKPVNSAAVDAILKATAVPIEVGGGIRDLETISFYLERGVSRVILGTAAHRHPELVRQACGKFPGRVVVGIDAREGKAAVEGWAETTAVPAEELARRYQGLGVRAIIFTDIARDGMLTGPAVESTRRLMRAVKIPVIASGGVKDIADIRELLPLARKGLEGVITGRAVYEGTLDLAEAIALSKQGLSKKTSAK